MGSKAVGLLRSGAKVIKVLTPAGKVIMRLPTTGAKVIKIITEMENGDTSDRCDSLDKCEGWVTGARRKREKAGGAC